MPTSHLTVREALSLPSISRGVPEVMAGLTELDRPIRWAHAGEVPNMASLLKGGELLLTTGMGIGRSERERRLFVNDLADREIAGLVLELGPTIRRVEATLAAAAEKRNLPLIALHQEVRFVEITEAIHREIVNRQFVLMQRGDDLHRHFTELMLAGSGIAEVLTALAATIGNPVVLEKVGHGILYHATFRGSDSDAIAAFETVHHHLDPAPPAIEQPVPMGGEKRWGRLVALAIDSPFDDFDQVALERAVALIALSLLRTREEDELAARQRGDFLGTLLTVGINETEARSRAGSMGFNAKSGAMVAAAVGRGSIKARNPDGWLLLWRDLQRELNARHVAHLAGLHSQDLLFVLSMQEVEDRPRVADLFARIACRAARHRMGSEAPVTICVGRAGRSWTAMSHGLAEATRALAGAAHARRRLWHDATQPDLERLLWTLRDQPDLLSFAHTRLAPLAAHDERRKSNLLETLAAYCANGGHKAQTARALHLERQSLYHRLERIEQLLDAHLDDEDTLLGVHLALRARRHFDQA